MKQYVDLRLLPEASFTLNTLMNYIFGEIHLMLVENGGNVGLSFPRYWARGLGEILRLHGTREDIVCILNNARFSNIKKYVGVGEVDDAPNDTKYRVFRRARSKSNLERCYRRSVRNGRVSEEEARIRISENKTSMLDLPFVKVCSLSTQQPFKLFVACGQVLDAPVDGEFSCYGLSDTKTVPWF